MDATPGASSRGTRALLARGIRLPLEQPYLVAQPSGLCLRRGELRAKGARAHRQRLGVWVRVDAGARGARGRAER